MIRWSTPEQVFDFPFSLTHIIAASIIYKQGKNMLLEKELSDCTITDNHILSFTMTQAESALFTAYEPAEIQINLYDNLANRTVSDVIVTRITENYKEEEMD